MIFIISLLPTANPDHIAWFVDVQYIIDDVYAVLNWANFFFPLDMLFRMMVITVAWSISMVGVKLIMKVITIVRAR